MSCGLETIEYMQDGPRIVHNQISEGCTELISRMILEYNGITPPNKGRYIENVAAAKILFEQYGPDAMNTYLTNSSKMINYFLSINIKNTNMLYFADNYIDFVNQMKNNIVSTDDIDLSAIYSNYVKYQSGDIGEEELLNETNENVGNVLRKIIEYKDQLKHPNIENDNENLLFDEQSRGKHM